MTINKQKIRGIGEDILGAGFHILSGAGGDVKQLIGQAVARMIGDAYVSRAEYEELLARVAVLEGKGKKATKPVAQAKKTPAKSASKKPIARKTSGASKR